MVKNGIKIEKLGVLLALFGLFTGVNQLEATRRCCCPHTANWYGRDYGAQRAMPSAGLINNTFGRGRPVGALKWNANN